MISLDGVHCDLLAQDIMYHNYARVWRMTKGFSKNIRRHEQNQHILFAVPTQRNILQILHRATTTKKSKTLYDYY